MTNQKHNPDLDSFLGNPVVVSQNVGWFLRLNIGKRSIKGLKETQLITDPLMIMVSSVKYTFK